MDKTQIDRLIRLANCLEELPDDSIVDDNLIDETYTIVDACMMASRGEEEHRPTKFNMKYAQADTPCGTACCALGWGVWLWASEPGVDTSGDNLSTQKLYGIVSMSKEWSWLFSSYWSHTQWCGPKDAARRIYWLLSGDTLDHHDMNHVPLLKECRHLPLGVRCTNGQNVG